MSVEAFGIEKEFLHELLRQAGDGRLQLPDFQRGWVWPRRNIASLLASVSLGYPVGTLMMLRTGGEVRFKQRPVEGVAPDSAGVAERLLLDGQQRMTSLYQALLRGEPVQTTDERGASASGWFYVDIERALGPAGEREESIRFIRGDRKRHDFRGQIVEDLSKPEYEYAACVFPLSALFDAADWADGFREYWDYRKEKLQLWSRFERQFVKRFEQYLVPVIELGNATPRDAVCQVFEKVNTGGVTLTVFELLTATYAADEFALRDDWDERRAHWASLPYRVLSGDPSAPNGRTEGVQNTDFLQAVTLLATYARRQAAIASGTDGERAPRVGCRRAEMLALTLDEYREWAPRVVDGFLQAARFLHRQYIFDTKFLPYGTQLIPLAAMLALLGETAESHSAQQQISRWFWCGVFGELYSGTTETRLARDLPEMIAWVRDETADLPRTIQEAQFTQSRLRSLRTRNSAAYKGIYTLPAADYDSIINKTPLSARTNRVIGGLAPSDYLHRIAKNDRTEANIIDEYVRTHLIDTRYLHKNDFDRFYSQRENDLLGEIGAVMGKPPVRDI